MCLRLNRDDRGYTLTEMLIAVLVFTFAAGLSFSALTFYHRIAADDMIQRSCETAFEQLHVYFQRQIDGSDVVYVKNDRVYLKDMETPGYYDDYVLDSQQGFLMRRKNDDHLKNIGRGASSQLAEGLSFFELKAEKDGAGRLTGNIILKAAFLKNGEGIYESVMAVPEGKDVIHME